MTYDLHGQWDDGKQWGAPGCPTGSCLRSHVNRTETMSALTMITKAGVPSNKVLVGVSSYGRSFQMADPSCTGPGCFFTGTPTESNARKGRCTNTGGYLANAELNEIMAGVSADGVLGKRDSRSWLDADSNSMIMVDGDLWVSYMDDDLKASRTQLYQRYNMGGTTDWAVDLVDFKDPPNFGTDVDLKLNWDVVKKQIKAGDNAGEIGCSGARLVRTGDWVNKVCTIEEVAEPSNFTATQRWVALGCQDAWDDAIRVYLACHGQDNYGFSKGMAEFLHTPNTAVSMAPSIGSKGRGN
ncbi:hypothetical protein IMZ48_17790 [Candidatus Bathyarchaeota archaeon]|nr:hypothetical protein [Candidatus Bathyarchaeota archaeon]